MTGEQGRRTDLGAGEEGCLPARRRRRRRGEVEFRVRAGLVSRCLSISSSTARISISLARVFLPRVFSPFLGWVFFFFFAAAAACSGSDQ